MKLLAMIYLNIFVSVVMFMPVPYELTITELDFGQAQCESMSESGKRYFESRQYEKARQEAEAAAACYHQLGDYAREVIVLQNIGLAYYYQGMFSDALAIYERALDIARDQNDREGESVSLYYIGQLSSEGDRREEALAAYQAALMIARDINHRELESGILWHIASVYGAQGEYDEALAMLQQVLKIVKDSSYISL